MPDRNRPRVLVVCTANACRSPVVERLLDRQLTAHGITAHVTSAGTRGGIAPVHANTLAAAGEINVDLGDHRPRRLTAEIIDDDGADLIITMTTEHLYQVVELSPAASNHVFTLRELAQRAVAHGVDPLTRQLGDWAASLSADRDVADLITEGTRHDVADPYGPPRRYHRKMIVEVDALVQAIVPVLAASIDPTS